MKELSIEEKAKAYDNVREKIAVRFGSNVANEIFSEYEESEDERIRKALINQFSDYKRRGENHGFGYSNDKILAWLEKQGEQNSDDKTEPKFKQGDWIVFNGLILCVKMVVKGHYIATSKDGITNGYDWGIDNVARLWTIQDAKDGDILCTYECDEPKIVFILKGVPKIHYALSYHCYYNIMYSHFDSDSEKGCLAPNDEDVKPATEEQRDLLFSKMEKAGYEWDSETKKIINNND